MIEVMKQNKLRCINCDAKDDVSQISFVRVEGVNQNARSIFLCKNCLSEVIKKVEKTEEE